MPFVLPAELGWAIVADQVTRFIGLLAFPNESLGLIQFHSFGILQG